MKIYIQLFLLGIFTSLLFPPFFFLPIGFLTIPYFFYIITNINNKSLKETFFESFIFGLGLNFCVFIWLKNPFLIEEETKNLFFISYIIVFYISFYFGLFALILRIFKNKKIQIIIFPVLFVIFEILRSKLFLSFPWNLFAYVLADKQNLSQGIKYIGTFGLSYVVIVIFLTPISLFNIINKINFRFNLYYITFIIFIFSMFYFITNSELKVIPQSKQNIEVVIYQNNTNQKDKWDIDKIDQRFNNLINFIEENKTNKNPTLLIFSETEIPYIISENDNLLHYIQSKLDKNTVILIGAIRKDQISNSYYNSMFNINFNNIEYFDKKILVPFGEYVPLENIFSFINRLSYRSSNFSKGKGQRTMSLFDRINFIPTICYENIFFENIITNQNKENNMIINITNDAWFGKLQGPYQHFYHSILRSIEYNKYLIRVSNNGISAIIEPSGKVVVATKLNEKTQIRYNLTIKKLDEKYFSEKYIIFYIYLLIMLIFCLVFRKNNNEK